MTVYRNENGLADLQYNDTAIFSEIANYKSKLDRNKIDCNIIIRKCSHSIGIKREIKKSVL